MPTATVETTIERSADLVWARIRAFDDLSWYPGVESCRLEGDTRIAVMEDGLEVDELRLLHDDETRTYAYAVVGFRGETKFDLGGGTMIDLSTMTDHHRAQVTVVPVDDVTCRVTYELELEAGHDEMMEVTTGGYRGVVEHLKRVVEEDR
jgi:hypothetical protein